MYTRKPLYNLNDATKYGFRDVKFLNVRAFLVHI